MAQVLPDRGGQNDARHPAAYISFMLKSAEPRVWSTKPAVLHAGHRPRFLKKFKDSKEMPEYQDFFQHYVNTLKIRPEVLH